MAKPFIALGDKLETNPAVGGVSQSATNWYAAQTIPRHEKRVQERLQSRGVHCFLPVYIKMNRWKNGCTARVEFPLFSSYLFVELGEREFGSVLVDPGVSRIVGSGREPVAIERHEIHALQQAARSGQLRPHEYPVVGERVRITRGPLTDLTGILSRKNNDFRVVLSLDLIRQGASVEVAIEDIEPVFEVSASR